MRTFTAPDLSITITEDEALHAFEIYHHYGWDEVEAGIPAGAKDVSGVLIDRNNQNLKIAVMASCALCHRLGPEEASAEAIRLLRNPMFEVMVVAMIEAVEKTLGNPA